MPMFVLAGGEILVLILVVAVGRWILRGWWQREREDEQEEPPLGRRTAAPRRLDRPDLRVVRGGRYQASDPPSSETGRRDGGRF